MARRDEASTKKNPPPGFPGEGHHQNTLHLSLNLEVCKIFETSYRITDHKYSKPWPLFSIFFVKKKLHFFYCYLNGLGFHERRPTRRCFVKYKPCSFLQFYVSLKSPILQNFAQIRLFQ